MLVFEIFVAILRLFAAAGLAVVFFPLWLLIVVLTAPLRALSPASHALVMDGSFKALLALPSAVFPETAKVGSDPTRCNH